MMYRELKEKHQNEFNSFPKGFAFTQEQLKNEIERLGVSSESDLIGIAGGTGFIRKSDKDAYIEMTRRHIKENKESMKNYDFAFDAFLYELNNHEYVITYDADDAIDALGLSSADFEANPVLLKALKAARNHIDINRSSY